MGSMTAIFHKNLPTLEARCVKVLYYLTTNILSYTMHTVKSSVCISIHIHRLLNEYKLETLQLSSIGFINGPGLDGRPGR